MATLAALILPIAQLVAYALVLALVACVPLLVYCFFQKRRGLLLAVGGVAAVGGELVAIWPGIRVASNVESTGAVVVFMVLLAAVGAVCAHVAVVVTKVRLSRSDGNGVTRDE